MKNEFEAPLEFAEQIVPPGWIDFNGHMNVANYVSAFDRCVDELFNRLQIGPAQIDTTHCSAFTLELHINYLAEVAEGDLLRVNGRLLDYDEKLLHAYFEMFDAREHRIVSAMEQVAIHIDMRTRKPAPFASRSAELLECMMASHRELPEPGYAGRLVGIRRK